MTQERSVALFVAAASVATLSALFSAGCTFPQATQSASDGGGAATPSPTTAPGLSCRKILQCGSACPDTDTACPDACVDRGSPDGKSQFRSLAACIEQEKCTEATCTQNKCAASLNACADTSAPSAPDAGGAGSAGSEPSADGPVVATMHAAALVREFETNIVRADELYLGKRVRVYGTVNSVSPDGNRIALVFKTSITTYSNLFCRFPQERASGLANLHTGDEATADGTVVGLTTGRLILENCSTP